MSGKSIFLKIYIPFLLITLVTIFSFAFYLTDVFRDFYLSRTEEDLKHQTEIIARDLFSVCPDSSVIKNIVTDYYRITNTRITIINIDGKVLADSKRNVEEMDNHSDRKEFKEVFEKGYGYDIRKSYTLDSTLMYVAIPYINNRGEIEKVIRASVSIDDINKEIAKADRKVFFASLIIFFISSLLGYFFSLRIRKYVGGMKSAALKFASGDFSQRIYAPDIEEFKSLADSMNTMASQLNNKIEIIESQKNLQEAVLKGMREGIIAVDKDDKVLLVNEETIKLLSLEKDITGKVIQECIRIPSIHTFISEVFKRGNIEDTVTVYSGKKELYLRLSGTFLENISNDIIGVLIVVTDITSLRHLDAIKRNLVANVSHELKTPVTAIKGFVETLIDGASKDEITATKFLNIIYENVNRLNRIIDDLLSLSKIEQYGHGLPDIAEVDIVPVIESVIENFTIPAERKKIKIFFNEKGNVFLNMNKSLFEQAMTNLIDNAVKYSPEHSNINIFIEFSGEGTRISVKDEGIGIEKKYIDKIFERFYRVEKSRTREEGGTGLGLSIVKHVMLTHGGNVEVVSTPGEGSVFTLVFPVNPNLQKKIP